MVYSNNTVITNGRNVTILLGIVGIMTAAGLRASEGSGKDVRKNLHTAIEAVKRSRQQYVGARINQLSTKVITPAYHLDLAEPVMAMDPSFKRLDAALNAYVVAFDRGFKGVGDEGPHERLVREIDSQAIAGVEALADVEDHNLNYLLRCKTEALHQEIFGLEDERLGNQLDTETQLAEDRVTAWLGAQEAKLSKDGLDNLILQALWWSRSKAVFVAEQLQIYIGVSRALVRHINAGGGGATGKEQLSLTLEVLVEVMTPHGPLEPAADVSSASASSGVSSGGSSGASSDREES